MVVQCFSASNHIEFDACCNSNLVVPKCTTESQVQI